MNKYARQDRGAASDYEEYFSGMDASMQQKIMPDWWPIAAGIALGGAFLGTLYPSYRAAKQDAIEALAYD